LNITEDCRKQVLGPVIAIGGFSGVGKDTLGSGLQKLLREKNKIELPILGAGNIIRTYAKELGYKESELDLFLMKSKSDEDFSRKLDYYIEEKTLTEALEKKHGIFIGRMAPFSIGRWGYTIWMETDLEEIAKRIIHDPLRAEYGLSYEEVLIKVINRDIADKERLERIYGIKLQNYISKVNCLLNNTKNDIPTTIMFAFKKIAQYYELEF
jgi:cytidylate kinase